MKRVFLTLCALLCVAALSARQRTEFKLWPAAGKGAPERVDAKFDRDNEPFVTLYAPDCKTPAPAVVICPGGAYGGLAIGHEGHQVAEWFAARGFAAVVLKYTMPHGNYDLPRRDVQQAIEMVRANAAAWNIDPARVGVIGFSAGGHLASTAATHFTCSANRPDFAVLIYPVITMDARFTHAGSRSNLLGENPSEGLVAAFSNERRVSSATPPVFIAFSDDDSGVPPVNGTMFYDALKAAGVPGEIHIYPTGGHGWGWNETFKYKDELRGSLVRWLSEKVGE